ncbi:MAG TPA: flavodoxin domain-containing protein [Microlunatus sp.]|nr:flavodoxin domain-containing protein [Microlunatus sp.]
MSRVLITYATRMGSTAEIARAIGDRITRRGPDAEVLPVQRVRGLARYDAVVVGSAVRLHRWLPEAVHWLRDNAPDLAERPTWLFQSGPCGADAAEPQPVPRAVARLAYCIGAARPVTFGGRLDPNRARTPVEQWFSRGPLAGDYRDWPAITRWADLVVDQLVRATSTLRAGEGRS